MATSRRPKRASRRSRPRRGGNALRDPAKPWFHMTFVEEIKDKSGHWVTIFLLNDDTRGYIVKMPVGTGGSEQKGAPTLRAARKEAKAMLASRPGRY